MQALSENGIFRGAQAMTDYANRYVMGGKKFSRAAIYRAIESGKIKVQRMGDKGTEVIAWKSDLDRFIGLEPEAEREAA